MGNEDWFAPKRAGFGIRPASWQGWAVVAAFAALLIAAARLLDPQRTGTTLPFAAVAAALCGVLAVFIVRKRGPR